MTNIAPDFLGREHFVNLGLERDTPALARTTFVTLVGRKVYPNDARLPDFENSGLIVVHRSATDLGAIPVFALYARLPSGSPADPISSECEEYAIGRESLEGVINPMISGSVERPRRFSTNALWFCDLLLRKYAVPPDLSTVSAS